MIHENKFGFLFLLVVIAAGLMAFLLFPFAAAFFAAAVIASALQPIQARMASRMIGRPYLVAGLLTAGVVLSVVVPLVGLSALVVNEGTKAVRWLNQTFQEKGLDGIVEGLPDPLEAPTKSLLLMLPASVFGNVPQGDVIASTPETPGAPAEKDSKPASNSSSISAAAGPALSALKGIGSFLAQAGVFVIALFILLAEGTRLVKYLVDLAPLEKARSRKLLSSFREVSVGVLLSAIATAAAQTIVATIGYLVASVPALPLVVFATFLCGFIPSIGGAVVTVATGAVVCMSGRVGMGVFLIVWGIAAVGMIDNLLKPWIANRHSQMSGSLTFFAMICGVATFGPLGLVAGPMIVTFFQCVTEMAREGPEAPRRVADSARSRPEPS